jgi:membrane fusion protein (multidrug efflux system)
MRAGSIGKIALASLLLLTSSCGGDAESARTKHGPPPPIVEVATVESGSLDEGLSLVGQLEPWESVVLRAETDGVIEAVEFREGEEVAAGAVLFRLRDGEQQARLREADAQLKLAEHAHGRARALSGDRIMAAAEMDQATANLDAARARVDLARVELDRTTVRAPFDGVLGARLVSPGDRITDDTDLVTIDAVAQLRLAFSVPEPIVELVKADMPLSIAVSPYPEETFAGQVYFVAPSLDPRSRQLLLKAVVPNPERRLRAGLFANVRLEAARAQDVLVAPESAVVFDPDGTFVFRVRADGTAEKATVELGLRRDGKVEVKSGLSAGDRIVSAGTNKVAAGRPVQVAGGDGERAAGS